MPLPLARYEGLPNVLPLLCEFSLALLPQLKVLPSMQLTQPTNATSLLQHVYALLRCVVSPLLKRPQWQLPSQAFFSPALQPTIVVFLTQLKSLVSVGTLPQHVVFRLPPSELVLQPLASIFHLLVLTIFVFTPLVVFQVHEQN